LLRLFLIFCGAAFGVIKLGLKEIFVVFLETFVWKAAICCLVRRLLMHGRFNIYRFDRFIIEHLVNIVHEISMFLLSTIAL